MVYAEQEPVEAVRRAFDVIEAYERALSDYDPKSEAMVLCSMESGVWHEASPILIEALTRSREAWEASGGAFDVTIGTVSAVWRKANESGEAPSTERLARARSSVGMDLVEIDATRGLVRLAKTGMRLDFGGIGKGLAADAALVSLRNSGLDSALVEIGGDLSAGEAPPAKPGWSVRADDGTGHGLNLMTIRRGAATSGDAFRFTEIDGVRGSHILEPGSGVPASAGPAVTVIASSGWAADAIATVARLKSTEAAERMARLLGGADVIEHSASVGTESGLTEVGWPR